VVHSQIEMMAASESQISKEVIERILSRIRGTVVATLIAGSCGGLHPTLLDPAAILLYTILRTSSDEDARSFYEAALQQDQFKLGDTARIASAGFFAQCCTGQNSNVSLMEFTEELWELHQHNELEPVAESDQVVAFIKKLASN
jgi:hypothetical protein